ncbi:unnamed protein product [Adineta steineri]|uniref:Uncharacterized protein n=1 Tax=Adineta steineri TaxID=433720 RepID=A0A814WEC0_9BILA|nr:unnamed protein product [Adineta steineri]CAF4015169.1 unnamed protein product [Adineta steineri]
MIEGQKKTTSASEVHTKSNTRQKIEKTKNKITQGKISIKIGIGILLTFITIILQCIAFFTPHWKEITPNTHSLYVDGVDALIRTEILHYFNTVHRYSHHSYGLFQRCENILSNSSIINNQNNLQKQDLFNFFLNKRNSKCTKNYLPSYRDDYFNKCHSLPYYQFCTKANEKNFDINTNYLRATFDISYSQTNSDLKFSCDCLYPPYAILCQIIGILALICLFATSLLYSSFPFFSNPHYRLKIKCFALLASVLAILFLMLNLIIIYQHLEYESIAYLIAIQKHYKSNQIYKLSQDTTTAINRFLSSINIRIGYSTILAWVAFGLAIFDAIFLLFVCRIPDSDDDDDEKETRTNLISSQQEDHNTFTSISDDNEVSTPIPPLPKFTMENNNNKTTQISSDSPNQKYSPSRRPIEDEV